SPGTSPSASPPPPCSAASPAAGSPGASPNCSSGGSSAGSRWCWADSCCWNRPRRPAACCPVWPSWPRSGSRPAPGASRPPGAPAEDPRWNEYDHLGLVRRYLDGAEPPDDSRLFQTHLDQALREWIDQGGWDAFAGAAVEALHALPGRLAPGQDAVVVTSA